MKKIFTTILFLICLIPSISLAADLSFAVEKNTFSPKEDFLVQVFLDTKDETINAVEGTVAFPTALLEVKEFRDGNSAIDFWVEQPHLSSSGVISYSGITTGGFSGAKEYLFSVVFHTKNLGSGQLSFDQTKVLKNDGQGTETQANVASFDFTISESEPLKQKDLSIEDATPPESFMPFIATDPAIFNGRHFLVFSTVDKGSGIDHYEVRESFLFGLDGSYALAQSPYELQNQSLLKSIFVKAVDKNGNERIVKLSAPNHLAWLLQFIIFVIILLIGLFVGKKLWLKFTK